MSVKTLVIVFVAVIPVTVGSTINDQGYRVFRGVIVLNKNDTQQLKAFTEAQNIMSLHSRTNNGIQNAGNWIFEFTKQLLIFHPSAPKITLDTYFNFTQNMSLTVDGAVFLGLTRENALLSEILRNSNVATIGIDRRNVGDSLTAGLAPYFTRVPTSPLHSYAFVMKDIINKLGWRRICLVVTADLEGLKFAELIQHFSQEEKWKTTLTNWLDSTVDEEQITNLRQVFMTFKPDVIIMFGRGSDMIRLLNANLTTSPWLVTDDVISETQPQDLPYGILRVGRRSVSSNHVYDVKLLAETMMLLQAAFYQTAETLCLNRQDLKNCTGQLDDAAIKHSVISYVTNYSHSKYGSAFRIPDPGDRPTESFDIWNLEKDSGGHTHWLHVGMWTHAGIALGSFDFQNGQTVNPPLDYPRPVLRVPVVAVPAWIEIGHPYYDGANGTACLSGAPCYVFHNSSATTKVKHCCAGAQIDLITLLENDLHFKADIYLFADGRWGAFNSSAGKWNGLMEQLTTGEGDVTALLGMNMARYKDVEFTQPYMNLGMNILVRKQNVPPRHWVNWTFLEPFHVDLWLMIICVSNVFLVVIWGLDRMSPQGHRRRIALLEEDDSPQDDGFTLLDSMSYVWGVAFSKDIGAENTPRSPSARFVSIFFAFMALILVNTYCANLTAVLMQESFSPPINGILDEKLLDAGLYPPNGFQLGVVRGSLEEWYFRNHSDRRIQLLYHVNIKINLVKTYYEGFTQLKEKKLDGLVGDEISLQAQANSANCDYKLIGKSFFSFGVGFAFPKDSLWLNKATLSVLKNQENGTIERIKKLRFLSKTCKKATVRRFVIDDFSGLFITVTIVIAFGIMVLFAELLFIYVLIKYWKTLGSFGRNIRYFLFGIQKDDGNPVDFNWLSTFGKRLEASWDVDVTGVTLPNGKRCFDQNGFNQNGLNGNGGLENYGCSISRDSHSDLRMTRDSARSMTSNDSTGLPHELNGKRRAPSRNGNVDNTRQSFLMKEIGDIDLGGSTERTKYMYATQL